MNNDNDRMDHWRNVAAFVYAYVQDDMLADEDERKWEKVTVNIREYELFNDHAFRLHFRLSKAVFMELSRELEEVLRLSIAKIRTPFHHVLLMVLWIMATPDSFRSVALRFGVHPSQLHDRYLLVIRGLCQLGPRYIKWPTRERRALIKQRVLRKTRFPGVVGIMDGKHFSITCPVEDSIAYRNYHHGYSVKAQAVCDDELIVTDLYVGEAGSLHDARVYRRSPLCTNVLMNRDLFSDEEHIIADSAYPLQDRIMCPFPNNGHLTAMQRNFNRKLSKGRVGVEHLFGHVSMIWRRIQHFHVRDMEYCAEHISATFVLHNFKILHGERPHHFPERPEQDDDDDVVERVPEGQFLDDDDPHIPLGNAAPLAEAQELGEQKRWNLVNELPW